VGLVFQSADAQLFSPTVREEIAFAPLQAGLGPEEIARRIADLGALLEIEDLLDRPPYRLSGGEKRKVALASVLAVNPRAVLLDEPTAGLDPRSQVALVRLLRDLHRGGKTVVAATNDLELLPRLASRAVVLDEGHALAADGPVREVLADRDLLLRTNLLHEQSHWHGDLLHDHPHAPGDRHGHGSHEMKERLS
jgi:cobalt/nickel transport system ATP-binding protein